MTNEPMTMSRFRSLIEAYGALPAHWPAAERAAAQAFLARHDEAKALVEGEAWIDRLLDSLPAAEPSAALKARLMPRARVAWFKDLMKALWPEAQSAWPAGVLAASMALGVAIGALVPTLSAEVDEMAAAEVVSFAFSGSDTGEGL